MKGLVNVQAVIESHRDRWGDLDADGKSLDEARLYALRNPHPDCTAAVQAQASRLKSADESLRKAGRVPVIYRERKALESRHG